MTDDAHRTPDDIRKWLTEILDHCPLLPAGLITRTPPSGAGRPIPSSKPPVKLDTLSLMDAAGRYDRLWEGGMQRVDPDGAGVLPYLWGWVRDLEATLYEASATLPDEAPETPTVANCAAWLSKHADAAAETQQWPELVYGLRILHRNVRAATAGVRDYREKPVPCSICGSGHLQRDGGQALWECNTCGHQVTVEAVTLRQAAPIVGVPLRTLQGWANRPGILKPIADGPRKRLFDLGSIQRLAAESRLRQA